MDDDHLEEQIERCRRLASMLTDDQLRKSLEELADQYEVRLKHRGRKPTSDVFMLQRRYG